MRRIVVILAIVVLPLLALAAVASPGVARAEGQPAPMPGPYTVTLLQDGSWLVLDTRTGAMERWTVRGDNYLYTRMRVGSPDVVTRFAIRQ